MNIGPQMLERFNKNMYNFSKGVVCDNTVEEEEEALYDYLI